MNIFRIVIAVLNLFRRYRLRYSKHGNCWEWQIVNRRGEVIQRHDASLTAGEARRLRNKFNWYGK